MKKNNMQKKVNFKLSRGGELKSYKIREIINKVIDKYL